MLHFKLKAITSKQVKNGQSKTHAQVAWATSSVCKITLLIVGKSWYQHHLTKSQKTFLTKCKKRWFHRICKQFIDTGGRGRTDTPVKERDFESRASANSATPACGGGNRIWTGDKGFADLCLTTWLCRHKYIGAEDGIRTRDPHLGKVVFYHWTTFAKMAGLAGFEPTHDGTKNRCLTAWL